MTEFYSGHGTRITHDVFEARCPSYEVFEIQGLSDVHALDWDCGSAPAALGAFRFVCAAVAVTVVAADWSGFEGAASPAAALGILAVAALVSVRYGKARARTYELWSVYHGEEVRLFYTTDPDAVAEVQHGLARAMGHRVNH